jgi:hypothetical protein
MIRQVSNVSKSFFDLDTFSGHLRPFQQKVSKMSMTLCLKYSAKKPRFRGVNRAQNAKNRVLEWDAKWKSPGHIGHFFRPVLEQCFIGVLQ